MHRTFVFLLSVVATTTARAADIGTTYVFSPDLKLEGNPAMEAIGFPGIIVVNVAVVLVASLLMYYWWRHPLVCLLPENPEDTWAFASLNYCGTEYSRRAFLFQFLTTARPKNWPMALQMTGFALTAVLVAGSGLAVFSWFAVHDWQLSWYRKAYFRTHWVFPYALLIPVYIAMIAWYFKSEHRRAGRNQFIR